MVHYDDEMDIGSDIDPEEEEKLDDALKEVLQSVPGCTVDKQTIKDMLWDSYYDVDAAIAYCVDKTAKAQKVEAMKKEQIEKKPEEPEPAKGKLSALRGSSKLASLRGGKSLASLKGNSESPAPSAEPTDAPPLSKLAKLRQQRLNNLKSSDSEKSSALEALKSRDRGVSKLARMGRRAESAAEGAAEGSPEPVGESTTPPKSEPEPKTAPLVDYTLPARQAVSTPFGTLFTSPIPFTHRPANPAVRAKASAKNFAAPSPDDIVLAKQQQAKIGALASNLGNLNLAAPAAKTDFSKWKPKIQPQDSAVTAITPSLNAVAVGHVDAGKSTLLGRLLHDTGVVSSHQVEKLAKSASEIGKKSFSYAWLMDQTDEERENGVTVDISVREFSYESREYFILDAPGHYNFVPNMIAGASQADVAVVVLDSLADAFERGFFADGQTKEHALLCRAMGVNHVVIAVNKMDQLKFNQERYDEISDQMGLFLSKIGYSDVQFVPCSGFTGANIVKKQDISWYHDKTIMATLQDIPSAVSSDENPLKLDVFNVKTSFGGVTVSGRLFSGMVQIDQPVVISPGNQVAIVRNIGVDLGSRSFAKAGENVNLALEAVDGCDLELIKAGDILAQYSDPVRRGNKFRARVTLFDVDLPVLKGTQCDFYRSRVSSVAVFSKLYSLLDKQGNVTKDKPRFVDKGQTAFVELILSDIIALELEKDNKHLSRFVLRRDGKTIGFGSVVKVARTPVDTSQVEKIQIGEDLDEEEEE
ncbi:HBS1-like protein [Yarrowia sp. C11]|nr:HBS1-like protein [Yarrowia sp. E02]KAG5373029.1 HBS1-like protein [Yarrowia sp. C11]